MTYTTDQTARIEALSAQIAGHACPQAVVDYLGRRDGDGAITSKSDPRRRFGTRDLRHVAIYGLRVVALNPAAASARAVAA